MHQLRSFANGGYHRAPSSPTPSVAYRMGLHPGKAPSLQGPKEGAPGPKARDTGAWYSKGQECRRTEQIKALPIRASHSWASKSPQQCIRGEFPSHKCQAHMRVLLECYISSINWPCNHKVYFTTRVQQNAIVDVETKNACMHSLYITHI